MSKPATIEVFIHWEKDHDGFVAWPYDRTQFATPGVFFVKQQTITVEIPDDFDPIPGQVAAIKKHQQELKAAFAKKMMELDSDLANLLCIESAV